MDARFWILVVPVWFIALIVVLISLMPAAPWARSRYWRIMRTASAAMVVLIAMVNTLNAFTLDRRPVFVLSPDASLIVAFVLAGLVVLVSTGVIFLGMLSVVRTPEAATRVLHVSPRLSAWLYERDVNENLQATSSPQTVPGDDR